MAITREDDGFVAEGCDSIGFAAMVKGLFWFRW